MRTKKPEKAKAIAEYGHLSCGALHSRRTPTYISLTMIFGLLPLMTVLTAKRAKAK